MTAQAFPPDMVLRPVSRWPTTLPARTVSAILGAPVSDRVAPRAAAERPRASIVILTHDGLVFTRLCLETLLAVQTPVEFEVIVVDNGSTDGTPDYLKAVGALDRRVRLQLNPDNTGYAGGVNRGVRAATGEFVVLLNNDTVPAGPWLSRLVNHLEDPSLGIVSAVTNRSGNEAEIDVTYDTYGGLQEWAAAHASAHGSELIEMRSVAMFCAGVRRDVWARVGELDERFEVGLFEDDDFAMRLRQAGLRVVYAEDVFVHHMGQGSIGQLAAQGAYGELFHRNRERWEEKWGMPWRPHAKRPKPGYAQLVERVRDSVHKHVPPGATVLVVSKGDEELLHLEGRRGWHFPQADDGVYAGYLPADSGACIAELERLRHRGAEFLVIPDSSRWWLEYYAEFASYLRSRYGSVDGDDPAAVIVPLQTTEARRVP